MAIHCNQCGTLLAEDTLSSGVAPAPAAHVELESAKPAEAALLPEWLFLEEEVAASGAGPPQDAVIAGTPDGETPEPGVPASEDLAAALRELSRAEELLSPREEPVTPSPPTEDLDKALRDLLGEPAPAPDPSPSRRLEDEGEFYRWLQQAMQDAPTEGEGGRGKGEG
ncbi:MAG: hypothetical protein HYY05_06620 [Chloroflexi bacterium]|nr:hypothetical protein [Chloroflexota bacterium]